MGRGQGQGLPAHVESRSSRHAAVTPEQSESDAMPAGAEPALTADRSPATPDMPMEDSAERQDWIDRPETVAWIRQVRAKMRLSEQDLRRILPAGTDLAAAQDRNQLPLWLVHEDAAGRRHRWSTNGNDAYNMGFDAREQVYEHTGFQEGIETGTDGTVYYQYRQLIGVDEDATQLQAELAALTREQYNAMDDEGRAAVRAKAEAYWDLYASHAQEQAASVAAHELRTSTPDETRQVLFEQRPYLAFKHMMLAMTGRTVADIS
jgi:hypothetical protein